MVQIAGKYVHTQSVNFVEHMVAGGVPEERAKAIDSEKNVEVKVEGANLTIVTDTRTHNYELGKETSETGPSGGTHKVTATLNGDVIKISAILPDGNTFVREYVFNDGGLEIIVKGKAGEAKRIFKRV